MDYDATELAVNYDRGRDHGPGFLDLWMNVVSSHVNGQHITTILDLGCGTGRFSEALAVHFNAHVIGIDPSRKMLAQARSKLSGHRIRYEPGSGESIPLPDNSVDLVFMSMVFHHFDNPKLAARECFRVLRADPEGRTAFLRTGTREQIPSYPYVEFFPESRPILEERLPTSAFVREVFESAGFRLTSQEIVTQQISPTYSAYAEKLAAGADSVLASLSKCDFDKGMKALEAHAIHNNSEAVFEAIDVFVFRQEEVQ